jgi:hypothetical protein
MAIQTTPHTESQANRDVAESDLEPGQTAQTLGTGQDAELYANNDGAEMGTDRNPRVTGGKTNPDRGGHGALPPSTTLEGHLESRTPSGEGQGITTRGHAEENAGQEKVVAERVDVQSGVTQR